MSDRPRRSLSTVKQDCLWDALLHTSTQQAPCQRAKSPQSSGSPSVLKLAEFQSYLRGIFRLISPLTETSWEYSLSLKVRAFKVVSNFRIIYLNLESELVISNWTLELSILTALPHQFKKKKETLWAFAVAACRTQTGYGPKSNGCCMKRQNYFIYVCACIHTYIHAYIHIYV